MLGLDERTKQRLRRLPRIRGCFLLWMVSFFVGFLVSLVTLITSEANRPVALPILVISGLCLFSSLWISGFVGRYEVVIAESLLYALFAVIDEGEAGKALPYWQKLKPINPLLVPFPRTKEYERLRDQLGQKVETGQLISEDALNIVEAMVKVIQGPDFPGLRRKPKPPLESKL